MKLIFISQDKAAQLVDKFGSLMKIAVAEKADDQRNNVVFDIFPKEHGFKEVFPGEQKKIIRSCVKIQFQVNHTSHTRSGKC